MKLSIVVFDRSLNGNNKKKAAEKSMMIKKQNVELETYRKRLENAQMLMLDNKLDANEYKSIKNRIQPEIDNLSFQIGSYEDKDPIESKVRDFGFYFLKNFGHLFEIADLQNKQLIPGSTFPEKLLFKEKNVEPRPMIALSSYFSILTRVSAQKKKGN